MRKLPIKIGTKKNADAWETSIDADPNRILVYDVETTGVTTFDHITTCAWAIGGQVKFFTFGDDTAEFEEDWQQASGVVTFNGTYFDERFLKKDFNIPEHPRHCDLRFFLKAEGRKGGLKKMAEAENMFRPADLAGVDGSFAIAIWKYYQETGEEEALNQLLAYNIWDVILTAELFKKFVMQSIPIENLKNPFKINMETLQKIKDYWDEPNLIADTEVKLGPKVDPV
jgi:uncharacterized protein YprB with RNaseH-like and TPR domain|tara:strand:+ start:385 stop:1065 length:681 start_codon:yes stop_codon:yes gene_type:complete